MTDHDIDVNPSVIWEELNAFNSDFFDSKLKLELNFDKKYITLQRTFQGTKIYFLSSE